MHITLNLYTLIVWTKVKVQPNGIDIPKHTFLERGITMRFATFFESPLPNLLCLEEISSSAGEGAMNNVPNHERQGMLCI